MLSYSRFLIINLIRKKSIYLLMAFYLFINILMVALRSIEKNKGGESLIESIDMYTMFFPFLLSTAFSLLVIIFNFKSTEKDGSDLLVCSKPVRRLSIFGSKFIVLIGSIILFQFYAFISLLVAGATDKEASGHTILTFAGSISFGGFLIQMIMASILVICAAFLNITSIISMGLLFSAVIPIASMVITTISEASPTKFWSPEVAASNLRRLELNEDDPDSNYVTDEVKKTSTEEEYSYNLQVGNSSSINHYYAWQGRNWYRDFVPFDIWYQWSGIMNLFRPERTNNMTSDVQNWYAATGFLGLPKDCTIDVEFEVNGKVIEHKFAFFTRNWWNVYDEWKHMQNDASGNTMPAVLRDYKALEQKGYISYDRAHQGAPNSPITPNQKRLLNLIKKFNSSEDFYEKYNSTYLPYLNIFNHYRLFLFLLQKQQEKQKNHELFSVYAENSGSTPGWIDYKRPSTMKRGANSAILRVDRPLSLYVSEPYIERKYIIEIWMGILAFMTLVASLVYTRKEFK